MFFINHSVLHGIFLWQPKLRQTSRNSQKKNIFKMKNKEIHLQSLRSKEWKRELGGIYTVEEKLGLLKNKAFVSIYLNLENNGAASSEFLYLTKLYFIWKEKKKTWKTKKMINFFFLQKKILKTNFRQNRNNNSKTEQNNTKQNKNLKKEKWIFLV